MKLTLWTFTLLAVSIVAHSTDDGTDEDNDDEGPLSNCANECLGKAIQASGCHGDDFFCQCNDYKDKFTKGFRDCLGSSSDCGNITLSDSDIQAFASDRCDALIEVSSLDSPNNSTTAGSTSTSATSSTAKGSSKSTTSSSHATATTTAANGTTNSTSKPKVSINPSEAGPGMSTRQGFVAGLAPVLAVAVAVLM